MTTARYTLFSALVLIMSVSAYAQKQTYKEYTPMQSRSDYFTIGFDKNNLRITVPSQTEQQEILVGRNTVSFVGGTVTSAAMLLFDERGLIFHDSVYPYHYISDIAISRDKHEIVIRFYTNAAARSGTGSTRRGNRFSFDQNIEIAKDEFVRGAVFSVKGDIKVDGEINKDVVSLFGNIIISPDAVVRGDLAGIAGEITPAKTSKIYGDTYSGTRKSWIRSHRLYRGEDEFAVLPYFSYNRVDGFAPYLTLRYQDRDTTLPTAWVTMGHGFASERFRFEFGMEQRLSRKMGLTLGAKYHQRIASSDDWLIGNAENTAFALLFTEDYKDFYETVGGAVYLKARPLLHTSCTIGMWAEDTKYLMGHRNLWSLFGGSKRFGENFGTVSEPERTLGISEIDTTDNVFLATAIEYDGTNAENVFDRSAWRVSGQLEWSDGSFGSDFDYRRYLVQVRRYQKTTRQSMLLLTGAYGGSDKHLPLNRVFFLGGLGTLYGYEHKEFAGTRFWMLNAEYRFAIPRRSIAFGLFWDGGRISDAPVFRSESEVKNSLGAALYLGKGFRMSLSRRLDRSIDNDPIFYCRFTSIY